jgi:predicted kinase
VKKKLPNHLILVIGCPGVGKTTVARELARQTQGLHFEIDQFKMNIVSSNKLKNSIDPPEDRFRYYTNAMDEISLLLIEKKPHTVIIDDTFHLHSYRKYWLDYAKQQNIHAWLVEINCSESLVKQRLLNTTDRHHHLLSKQDTVHMHWLFKEVFEPVKNPLLRINTSDNIITQVSKVVRKLKGCDRNMMLNT